MKFVDPKTDIAFKKIFGSENHKTVLIEFLNAVLDLEAPIVEVTLLNPYQAPKLEGLKETTLDVRARDALGREFIVEMQVEKETGFEKRLLYYTAKTYVQQLEEGDAYHRLRPVIFLGVFDFRLFRSPGCLTRHLIVNPDTGERALKDFEFNFIELPKFQKQEHELQTLPEQWIYFLKNVQNLDMVPASATSAGLREAYAVADKFGWTREELELYEYQGMQIGKLRGQFEAKWLDGLARGREEGRTEGEQNKALAVARNLLPLLDDAAIAEATGLAPEMVARLRAEP